MEMKFGLVANGPMRKRLSIGNPLTSVNLLREDKKSFRLDILIWE